MPRGKKNKAKAKHDYIPAPVDQLEGGVTVPIDKVPTDVREALMAAAEDDNEQDGGFAGSEFIDGHGVIPENPSGIGAARAPAPPEALPLPKLTNQQPPAAMAPADTVTPPWTPPVLPETATENDKGELVTKINPVRAVPVEDGPRRQLTWVVTAVNMATVRDSTGKLTVEITVTAMLTAATTRQVDVGGQPGAAGTKEPFMDFQHLFSEPATIKLPLWLFPPDKQRRPDTISIVEATNALIALFATTPFEIVRPAPLSRMLAALPSWYREELAKKGTAPRA